MYLKKAMREVIAVFFFTVAASVFSYLLRIILARKLSIAEYGLFFAIFSFFSIFTLFIDLGLSQAVTKYVVDLSIRKKYAKIKSIIVYTFYLQMLISTILFLAFFVYAKNFSQDFFKTADYLPFVLMGIWFMTLPIVSFFGNIFSGFKKVHLTSSMELFRQLASCVICAVLIFSGFGLRSPFIAYACLNILMLLFYAPFIKLVFPQFPKLKAKQDSKIMKTLLKYGAYITVSSLISSIIMQTDTILLTLFKGTESVGLYQVVVPLSFIVSYASISVVSVAFPFISELNFKKDKARLKEGIELIYKYLLIICLPIALILFMFPQFIIATLFGAKYISASTTLQVLLVASIFSVLASINSTILTAMGLPKKIAGILTVAALANVVLNVILIPKFDILGSAIASMFCFMLAFLFSSHYIKKISGISFPYLKSALIIICGCVAALLVQVLRSFVAHALTTLGQAIVVSSAFLLTYAALLLITRAIKISEIKNLLEVAIRS